MISRAHAFKYISGARFLFCHQKYNQATSFLSKKHINEKTNLRAVKDSVEKLLQGWICALISPDLSKIRS